MKVQSTTILGSLAFSKQRIRYLPLTKLGVIHNLREPEFVEIRIN